MESLFDVHVITQNVDDLHERAGSSRVMHLHGEIRKARSTQRADMVLDLPGTELNLGDVGPDGAQLRPHIVWFGEAVPLMDAAMDVVAAADMVIVLRAEEGSNCTAVARSRDSHASSRGGAPSKAESPCVPESLRRRVESADAHPPRTGRFCGHPVGMLFILKTVEGAKNQARRGGVVAREGAV